MKMILVAAFSLTAMLSQSLTASTSSSETSLEGSMPSMSLERELSPQTFVISAEHAQELMEQFNLSQEELLRQLVPIAQTYAKPAISNYYVGASVLGRSGAIYLGANLEFARAPLSQTVHAEQFAIALAHIHGETGIQAIAISASPCGHCRQFMQEIGDRNIVVYSECFPTQTLGELLPNAFSPDDLGLEGNMLSQRWEDFVVTMDYSSRTLALIACLHSYAPYSNAKAGVALQTEDGRIYTGSYLENVGFNPSLPPVQSALVALIADGREYNEIQNAFLMESVDGLVNHEIPTRFLLRAIAPKAEFRSQAIDLTSRVIKS